MLLFGKYNFYFRYEGEFLHGWFHGHGIFWRADGMKYEGKFDGGKMWGLGKSFSLMYVKCTLFIYALFF